MAHRFVQYQSLKIADPELEYIFSESGFRLLSFGSGAQILVDRILSIKETVSGTPWV